MKHCLREYFSFTRSERNGTIILCFILLTVLMIPRVYIYFSEPAVYQADQELLDRINAFYAHIPQDIHSAGENVENRQTADPAGPAYPLAIEGVPQAIELNSADTTDLMQVTGIGPVLSRRILNYRNILGGYASVSQLLEVYGIGHERYLNISTRFWADTTGIIPLKPASDEFSALLRHPYLDFGQVSQIFRLRETGNLNSPADLLQSPSFTESDLQRLLPYLSFDCQ